MSRSLPDFEYVNSILSYDPDTGVLTWRERPREHFATARAWKSWNARFAGKEAGGVMKHQRTFYRTVGVKRGSHRAHRLAYLLHHGVWPENDIDHIDGNGLNNRIDNLRDATHKENNRNKRMYLCNISGVTGVTWYKPLGKWRAYIKINDRQQHLGYFDTIEEAAARFAAARLAANEQHGYTDRHGAPETLDDALAPFL